MAFFQMDDGFETEARVMRAGRPAFGLYAACGIWVARHLTDGFIPAEIAALYGTREWIEKLCTTGLWVAVDGGFDMPDYLGIHGNPTAETVRKRRADAALRKQRQRDKTRKPPNGGSRGESRVTGTVTHGGSPASLASPPPKGGEGAAGAAAQSAAATPSAPPPDSPPDGGCPHGYPNPDRCAACRRGIGPLPADDDLDQRPPVPDDPRKRPPSLAAAAVAPPDHYEVPDDMVTRDQATAEYEAARQALDAVKPPERQALLDAALAELRDAGSADPPTSLIVSVAAEIYNRPGYRSAYLDEEP